jgi:hypothetical protein
MICYDPSTSEWMWVSVGGDPTPNFLNDLWEYNLATNEWTLLKGNVSGGSSGHYGELNVPDALNVPPSRYGVSAYWTDRSTNSHYMFGGSAPGNHSGSGTMTCGNSVKEFGHG